MLREAIDITHQKIIYPYLTFGAAQKDREIAHEKALKFLKIIHQRPLIGRVFNQLFSYENPSLKTEVLGLKFRNPLGIAAGFDKDGLVFNSLFALGFSHTEIGTITLVPQSGNPRPRIQHLPALQTYINRMGFPSQGVRKVAQNILEYPPDAKSILGLNIGPNTETLQNGESILDYLKIIQELKRLEFFRKLKGRVYLDINVSCHNIPGLINLQDKQALVELISTVSPEVEGLNIPLVMKISHDLSWRQLDDVLNVSLGKIDGIVVANAKAHPEGALSGKPLTKQALDLSKYAYQQTKGKLPIIRSGGIMTPQDCWEAIFYGGSSLVQVQTAFVEEKTSTPNLAYYFNHYLHRKLDKYGFKNITEAKGQGLDKIR